MTTTLNFPQLRQQRAEELRNGKYNRKRVTWSPEQTEELDKAIESLKEMPKDSSRRVWSRVTNGYFTLGNESCANTNWKHGAKLSSEFIDKWDNAQICCQKWPPTNAAPKADQRVYMTYFAKPEICCLMPGSFCFPQIGDKLIPGCCGQAQGIPANFKCDIDDTYTGQSQLPSGIKKSGHCLPVE